MSDEVGDNGELIGIFEKPMNVQNDNDDHDAVVNDTMDLEQSQEGADKTGLSMESMKISEKQMELKAPECGYLEAVEGGAENDQENLSETANIPFLSMESMKVSEKQMELKAPECGYLEAVEGSAENDQDDLSETANIPNLSMESMKISEKQLELKAPECGYLEAVEGGAENDQENLSKTANIPNLSMESMKLSEKQMELKAPECGYLEAVEGGAENDQENLSETANIPNLSMESMKISEKQMELKAPECGYLEAVEGGAENDQENLSETANIPNLSMESMKISEKQMELKAPECGYIKAVEGAAENDQENRSETANIPMESIEIFEKPAELKADSVGHIEVLENTVNDLEKMSDEFGKNRESLEIFEKPIELISAKDGNFKIVEDTVRNLEKIESPLNVVAIAGLYRTGKSYLMNRLAGKTNGFILGSSIESTTKGIWAWCKKHPTKDSQVLLLLDTEGLGDVKKGSIDHDNKIFTIVTLLSSTLVYNTMSAFNQDAIEKLTYITMLSKNLKVTSSSSSDQSLDCIMPQFVLCLRDFNLELSIDGKEITEDEYLEDCLKTKEVETPEDEKYNRPRECIKKYFTHRKVFTFDRPAGRSVMRRLDTAGDEDLNEEFIQETERFMSYVYDCPGKVLLNKLPVTGSMLAKLLRVYVHAINEGSVPCVEDAMVTMSRLENERHTKNAVEEYKLLIKQIQLPVFDKKKLQKSILKYQEDKLSKLHSKLLFDTDNKIEKATKAEMQTLYEQIDKQNGDLLYENCIAKIQEMHKKIVKTNMKKGKYAVAGGHTIYNSDMHELFEEYNRDLKIIDLAVRQRAQNDFENEIIPESKKIMEEDKMYSEKEMKESVAIKVETIKQDFVKTQEEQHKTLMAELDRQNTQHINEMENIRKAEREKEKRKQEKYKNEVAELRRKNAELEANERLRCQQEAERQKYENWQRRWAAEEAERQKRCILS